MKKNLIFCCLLALICSCTDSTSFIAPDNQELAYEGRIIHNNDNVELIWPGTSVSIHFKGSEISAILQDEDTSNYYNVIMDNKVISKIHPNKEKQNYILASGLDNNEHTLQLFKRTEWDKGRTYFYGFDLNGGKILSKPAPKKRKIEFYGNSITCGYATEDYSQDRSIGKYENNYVTYAAVTARHFDAQYYCIAKSGIGILVSWFPLIMPEMYNRTDPTDSTSVWDFSQYSPDIVVINLFQNDSWIVNLPQHEEFKHRFGDKKPSEDTITSAYKNFVSSIREKYPKASIICALGSMDATCKDSPWPFYIEKAVTQLEDKNIYTCYFPYKNTPGHPRVEEQQVMADILIKFIDDNIEW